jgi:formylglycine-generating enzyme required for sulfatase activity
VVPKPPGGTVALFSCSQGEISHESLKQKRGFLFHHVIEGLSGKAANQQGEVTWNQLVAYVTNDLPLAVLDENGPDVHQTPESFGSLRGKMVLARSDPRNEPKDEPVVRVDPKEITNSIGIKLMRIPKGKFLMGSPRTEKKRNTADNETQHEVTISQNFYMGATEVTQAQWQKVMGNEPSKFKGDQLPVETVSWEEAVKFCKRLSEMPEEKKAGRKYRLPTESEWEYACRAGTTTPFHFGSQLNGRQANCDGTDPYGTETKGPYLKKTSPVGTYPANAWGLYDMHGNVWEWCSDWHGEYPAGSVTDPIGPATGSYRINRGGCWGDGAVICRSASCGGNFPSDRSNDLGFRVALSVPQPGRDPRVESGAPRAEVYSLEKMMQLIDIDLQIMETEIVNGLDDASKAVTPNNIAKANENLKKQLDALNNNAFVREDRRKQLANRLLIMIRELERRAN